MSWYVMLRHAIAQLVNTMYDIPRTIFNSKHLMKEEVAESYHDEEWQLCNT